jgi:hypothetical protein
MITEIELEKLGFKSVGLHGNMFVYKNHRIETDYKSFDLLYIHENSGIEFVCELQNIKHLKKTIKFE